MKLEARRHHCVACGETEGVSLYSFPTDPSLREKWLTFCNLEESQIKPHSTRLCQKHFSSENLYPESKSGVTVKKKNAIPTIHLPNVNHNVKPPCKRTGIRSNTGRRCCFIPCRYKDAIEGLSYFKFPNKDKDSDLFDKWVQFLRVPPESILPNYKLCSLHFSSADIIDRTGVGGGRTLVKTAIPIIRKRELKTPSSAPRGSTSYGNSLVDISDTVVQSTSSNNVSFVDVSDIATVLNTSNIIPSVDAPNVVMACDSAMLNSSRDVVNSVTPTKSSESDFQVPRYIGMIHTPHLETPNRAKACISFCKQQLSEKNKTIKNLSRTNARLRKKLKTVNELLRHLQKKSLISESARLKLMVIRRGASLHS